MIDQTCIVDQTNRREDIVFPELRTLQTRDKNGDDLPVSKSEGDKQEEEEEVGDEDYMKEEEGEEEDKQAKF